MKGSVPTTSLVGRRWRVVAGALAIGLAAASCGGSSESSEASPLDQAAAQTTMTQPVAQTASGGQLDFGSLEGTDYVLWFWAPW